MTQNLVSYAQGAGQSTPAPSYNDNYASSQPQMSYNGIPQRPDPDLMYSDPRAYADQMERYQDFKLQQHLNAVAAPVLQSQAAQARHLAKSDPEFSDIWRRYEPEIEAELAGIPQMQRSKELYDKAAEIVRGRHWRDFAREEAERIGATSGFTERGAPAGGTPPAAVGDPLDTYFESDAPHARFARDNGLTKAQIRAYCKATGTSIEDYVKNAASENLIRTNAGFVRRSS